MKLWTRTTRRAAALAATIALSVTALPLLVPAAGASRHESPRASSKRGGILYMLGTGDIDYMDPGSSDYTVGFLGLRMWTRQLVTYPAVAGKTTDVVPDLATALPVISANGLTYTETIRKGAMWNTSPPRQVTAADAVRGLERSCNPVQPNDELTDFESLIVGMAAYCSSFEKVKPTVGAIRTFLDTHSLAGATVSPSNPLTVVYKLTHPSSYFTSILAEASFTPVPVEFLDYLPASSALAQHTISDGPYEIKSYVPGRSILFVRNPAWNPATDPVCKAYVDEINVNETVSATTVQEELATHSPNADLAWGDTQVPLAQVPSLLASHNPDVFLGPSEGLDPFLIFNFASKNNGGALQKLSIRQALSYAIDRATLIQDDDGPSVSPPLTQALPPGVAGSSNLNLYPYDLAKAKKLLGSTHLTLKVLYQANSQIQSKMFQTLQYDLSKVGVTITGLGVPTADIYTKYLEVPSVAKSGVWDIAFDQWYPDWYGDNTVNFLEPLFLSASAPPGGDNLGLYASPVTDKFIIEGMDASSESAATSYLKQADLQIMKDAAFYPINSPNLVYYHASQVQNAIWVPTLQDFDPTNVWLPANDRVNA